MQENNYDQLNLALVHENTIECEKPNLFTDARIWSFLFRRLCPFAVF